MLSSKWVEKRGLGLFKNSEDATLFAIHSGDSTDGGSWPSYDLEADTEIDLVAELAQHLPKGEVAVLMEIGAEKLRYLSGIAIAVNHKGRAAVVSLDDVYRILIQLCRDHQCSDQREGRLHRVTIPLLRNGHEIPSTAIVARQSDAL